LLVALTVCFLFWQELARGCRRTLEEREERERKKKEKSEKVRREAERERERARVCPVVWKKQDEAENGCLLQCQVLIPFFECAVQIYSFFLNAPASFLPFFECADKFFPLLNCADHLVFFFK